MYVYWLQTQFSQIAHSVQVLPELYTRQNTIFHLDFDLDQPADIHRTEKKTVLIDSIKMILLLLAFSLRPALIINTIAF